MFHTYMNYRQLVLTEGDSNGTRRLYETRYSVILKLTVDIVTYLYACLLLNVFYFVPSSQ